MTFQGISEFLGESPLPRRTATTWNTFDKVFDLLWDRDDPAIKKGCGWIQRYRQGYHRTLDLLFEIDRSSDSPESLSYRLKGKIRTLFEYHCPCVLATSVSKWIAPYGRSLAWLAFCRDGRQDGYATSPDEHPEEDNSWAWIRMSFKRDRMFSLSARDIVVIEEIEELMRQRRVLQFRSYDDNQKELVYYQTDESARISTAELRNAKENRRRQIERENAKSKPHIILQELENAKQLERKRRIDEETREINDISILRVKRARKREDEEKRIRAQESYQIVKKHFTPTQIFQRKFPLGRSLGKDDDDDDPLSFDNLCKAVKRGWWGLED
jgi:hypothetical protein